VSKRAASNRTFATVAFGSERVVEANPSAGGRYRPHQRSTQLFHKTGRFAIRCRSATQVVQGLRGGETRETSPSLSTIKTNGYAYFGLGTLPVSSGQVHSKSKKSHFEPARGVDRRSHLRIFADQSNIHRAVIDAPPDRDRGVSAEALGMPCGALLIIHALAQPRPLAIVRLDVADGLGLDFASGTRKPELQRSRGTTYSALPYGVCWMYSARHTTPAIRWMARGGRSGSMRTDR